MTWICAKITLGNENTLKLEKSKSCDSNIVAENIFPRIIIFVWFLIDMIWLNLILRYLFCLFFQEKLKNNWFYARSMLKKWTWKVALVRATFLPPAPAYKKCALYVTGRAWARSLYVSRAHARDHNMWPRASSRSLCVHVKHAPGHVKSPRAPKLAMDVYGVTTTVWPMTFYESEHTLYVTVSMLCVTISHAPCWGTVTVSMLLVTCGD